MTVLERVIDNYCSISSILLIDLFSEENDSQKKLNSGLWVMNRKYWDLVGHSGTFYNQHWSTHKSKEIP